jgi:hypothetical protein
MMDTQAQSNYDLVNSIKKTATSAGLYEAFLEAAPQFILQMTLILRTGNLSKQTISVR